MPPNPFSLSYFVDDNYISNLLQTYSVLYSLMIVKFSVGHPLDVLKTRLQANTNRSACAITRSMLQGGIYNIYAVLGPSFAREALKPLYRTPLTTVLPKKLKQQVYDPLRIPYIVTPICIGDIVLWY